MFTCYQYSICGKTRGGQQCIFDVFLTKPVGVNENLGVERHQGGLNPPTNRALHVTSLKGGSFVLT